jgi:hypothetical protein
MFGQTLLVMTVVKACETCSAREWQKDKKRRAKTAGNGQEPAIRTGWSTPGECARADSLVSLVNRFLAILFSKRCILDGGGIYAR